MKITKWYTSSGDALYSDKVQKPYSSGTAASGKATAALSGNSAALDRINHNVFNSVDDFLYLNGKDRVSSFFNLSGDEKEKFLKIIGKLLQEGVIGYEKLEVDGIPEKHFIVNQIGDKRLYGAKLYDEKASSTAL